MGMTPDTSSDSEAKEEAPGGLYILSGFLLLGAAVSVYYAIAAPHYRVFAAIFGPLLLYTGFGLVPRWKGARLIAIIMISITLLLAVLTLVSMYFLDLSDEYGQDDLLRFTALNGVRIIVLPFVLFYLFGKRVRAYYSRSNY